MLKEPEFQVKQRKKGLHWKDQANRRNPRPSRSLPDLAGPCSSCWRSCAKWVLIALAAAGLVYVLWRNRRLPRQAAPGDLGRGDLPETLFGLDIRPESLPAGLEGVAARLWAEGRIRAALALLYRGALAHLVHRYQAPLAEGATEGDCLRKAREAPAQASADYFARLTRTWLEVAYAGLAPAPGLGSPLRRSGASTSRTPPGRRADEMGAPLTILGVFLAAAGTPDLGPVGQAGVVRAGRLGGLLRGSPGQRLPGRPAAAGAHGTARLLDPGPAR